MQATRPRLVTKPFVLVTLANFTYFLCVGVLIPAIPLYVEGPLGRGSVAVGIAIGSFSLAAVVLRPLAGRIGDEHGRRVLIVSGALLVAVSVLGYVVADSLAVLIALRLVTGAGEAFFYTGVASAINDLAPDERRGEALSLFSLALYGGLALGPVVGESVLGRASFDAAWIVAAVCAFAGILIGSRVPETRPERDLQAGGPSAGRRLVHPSALLPGAVLAASVWGLAGFNAFVPLYARDIGMDGSRSVFVVFSAIVLAIRSVGARLPDRLGTGPTARTALTLSAIGLAVAALWGTPAGLLAGTALFAIGQGLAFPTLMSLAVTSAPASERASVVGTFTAFFDLGFGLGGVSLGAVAAATGYRGAFYGGSLAAGAGLVLLLITARTQPAGEAAEVDGAVAGPGPATAPRR